MIEIWSTENLVNIFLISFVVAIVGSLLIVFIYEKVFYYLNYAYKEKNLLFILLTILTSIALVHTGILYFIDLVEPDLDVITKVTARRGTVDFQVFGGLFMVITGLYIMVLPAISFFNTRTKKEETVGGIYSKLIGLGAVFFGGILIYLSIELC